MMRLNRTCVWKVMTIWILDIFRCSISSVSICDVPESDLRVKSYDHLNFSRASVVQFRASRYLMCLNRTSEWKVMTILISREFPLFNNQCLDILCTWITNLREKIWPFEFLKTFRCSILSISISNVHEWDIWVKSNDNFNLSGVSIVQ